MYFLATYRHNKLGHYDMSEDLGTNDGEGDEIAAAVERMLDD